MENSFRFKHFCVQNRDSALKVGTDAVLLGSLMSLRESDRRALDIGTGTGVIALMAAQRLPSFGLDFLVEAVEIDPPSAREAGFNFESSPWKGSVILSGGRLQDFRPQQKFDIIFSNPPFYDGSLLNPDSRKSGARHCCELTFQEICSFCRDYLKPEGRLSVILPSDREASVTRYAASFGLFIFRAVRIRTTENKPARRVVMEFSFSKAGSATEENLVLQEGSARSREYSLLTSEFYL